jgi:hypothetical protein
MKWYNTMLINAAHSPTLFKPTVLYHVPPALEHGKLYGNEMPRAQNRKYDIPLPDMSLKIHLNSKVKVNFTLEQATKAQRGSRCIALLFNLSAGWGVSGQRHAPAALTPVKTRYPLYRRLGVPQGRSGRLRKISPPPRFDPRTANALRVAIPTELPRPCHLNIFQNPSSPSNGLYQ